jgi:pimeloyl-ACP methyl ester carboxylesterase
VLIHGVGLRAEAWNRQIDALSPEFHVTAVDVPGHGESHLSDDNPGLSDYTDGIAAVLDGPALVIGHSMGAMIALDMAVRFPDRVRGVAALNAVFDRSNAASKAVQVRAEGLDGASRADPSEPLDRWFGAVSSPQRDACRKWLCDVDPVTYRAAYRVFARENGPGREELVTLACPALFATGSEEPNSTPAMSREMATLARYGQSAIVNGAAHMMQMTHPDEVNSVLLTFAQNVTR